MENPKPSQSDSGKQPIRVAFCVPAEVVFCLHMLFAKQGLWAKEHINDCHVARMPRRFADMQLKKHGW